MRRRGLAGSLLVALASGLFLVTLYRLVSKAGTEDFARLANGIGLPTLVVVFAFAAGVVYAGLMLRDVWRRSHAVPFSFYPAQLWLLTVNFPSREPALATQGTFWLFFLISTLTSIVALVVPRLSGAKPAPAVSDHKAEPIF